MAENFKINVEEMAAAGLHFGHRTSKLNPKMLPFIFGTRNSVHIIDLEKTKEKLIEALKFIEELVKEKKTILFVGTKIQIRNLLKEVARECGLPYINERWLGGTFTNFSMIRKRVEYLIDLEKKLAEGYFDHYTKKEKKEIEKKIENLKKKFEGLKTLEKIPEAIFVCDMVKEKLAVKEAKKKKVKVIAIADTNADPSLADYPIPANDDAISSVRYILERVKKVIVETKNK